MVRQSGGQHGQYATREVHRSAALTRISVERTAHAHVVTDVGNRHHQSKTLGVRFGEHRIIEIPGVFTIDGDER